MAGELSYINDWVKQDEQSLLDISCGSCVLIKFKDKFKGITADDNSTVDISWMRREGKIVATGGVYEIDDIDEWKAI